MSAYDPKRTFRRASVNFSGASLVELRREEQADNPNEALPRLQALRRELQVRKEARAV